MARNWNAMDGTRHSGIRTQPLAHCPPRDVRICTIIARRGTHSFWVALYEGEEAQIRLVWTDGGPGQSAVKDSQKGKC